MHQQNDPHQHQISHDSFSFNFNINMSFGIITILSARCEAPGDVEGICPIIAIIGAISHEGRTQASYKHLPSETNILGQKVIKEGCILRHDKINIRVNK